MNAPVRLRTAVEAEPLCATFRVRQHTATLYLVERRTTGGNACPDVSGWHECGRSYCPDEANRLAQDWAQQFRDQRGCEAVALPFPRLGRVPGRAYTVPADPAPGAGMTLRAEGFPTFVGRIG